MTRFSKKASSSQMKIIHFKVVEMPTFKDIVVMIAKHSDQPCVTGKRKNKKQRKHIVNGKHKDKRHKPPVPETLSFHK
jgi:hypothetical protein